MKYFVVDAFTDHVFGGGPGGVVFSDEPLTETEMQNISMENDLADTAFLVRNGDAYDIRWFMPDGEINLNGHATMAASYCVFRFFEPEWDSVTYHSPSGDLVVRKEGDWLSLDLPAIFNEPDECTEELVAALGGARPSEVYFGQNYLCVFPSEADVAAVKPDFEKMKALLKGQGVFITAEGDESDIVGRTFWPKMGVNEDPVCGNMHCNLTPFWSKRLGKKELVSHQLSKRGAVVRCEDAGDRAILKGQAALFLAGEAYIK